MPQAQNITTVPQYLKSLPEDRRKQLAAVRRVVLKNLPKGFKETLNWGMICYEVPLKTFPNTYNGKPLMFAALGSQKNYMVLHLMCLYLDKSKERQFRKEFKASGRRLDMGKACVRFKSVEDLPLEVVGRLVRSTSLKDFLETAR